jgi:SAM-dependent methyltransferase
LSHPERIVPDETSSGIVAVHLKRYEFARPACAGKDVLDAGCGVGYGSAFLAEVAQRVTGVDLSPEAIDYARGRYELANVGFQVSDLAALDLSDDSFDVVCAFETIEHVPDADRVLAELVRVLRPEGTVFLSTPRAGRATSQPENPFHQVEYDAESLSSLLRRHFADVTVLGQRRLQTRRHRALLRLDVLGLRRRLPALRGLSSVLGTPATAHVTLDEIVIEPDRLEQATELVAVCRAPR